MRDDPQGGSLAHVALKAPCRRVVHSPDAGRAVDLRAGSLAQHLAGAGHDAAELTVQLKGLLFGDADIAQVRLEGFVRLLGEHPVAAERLAEHGLQEEIWLLRVVHHHHEERHHHDQTGGDQRLPLPHPGHSYFYADNGGALVFVSTETPFTVFQDIYSRTHHASRRRCGAVKRWDP